MEHSFHQRGSAIHGMASTKMMLVRRCCCTGPSLTQERVGVGVVGGGRWGSHPAPGLPTPATLWSSRRWAPAPAVHVHFHVPVRASTIRPKVLWGRPHGGPCACLLRATNTRPSASHVRGGPCALVGLDRGRRRACCGREQKVVTAGNKHATGNGCEERSVCRRYLVLVHPWGYCSSALGPNDDVPSSRSRTTRPARPAIRKENQTAEGPGPGCHQVAPLQCTPSDGVGRTVVVGGGRGAYESATALYTPYLGQPAPNGYGSNDFGDDLGQDHQAKPSQNLK